MVWAFANFTGNTNANSDDGLNYHDKNYGFFTTQIDSDGTVYSGGDNGLSPTPVTTTEVLMTANGNTLSVAYNAVAGLVQYNVHVKVGTYLGIGYGTSMTNVDMVAWEAGSTAETSFC